MEYIIYVQSFSEFQNSIGDDEFGFDQLITDFEFDHLDLESALEIWNIECTGTIENVVLVHRLDYSSCVYDWAIKETQ